MGDKKSIVDVIDSSNIIDDYFINLLHRWHNH